MSDDVHRWHEANRLAWNEAAARYEEWIEETIAFVRGGGVNLERCERDHLGEQLKGCRRAIHLQCASGKDTLSLWNMGAAEVVGVDISDKHIANARALSAAVGAPARWFRSDVLATPAELDGSADLVYTGKGALSWLHDLTGWAAVTARLLAPRGRLYVYESHPITALFDIYAETWQWTGASYFDFFEESKGWPATYLGALDRPDAELASKYEQLWTLGQVVTAVAKAGLRVERLTEHGEDYWDQFPKLPEDIAGKLPRSFSLLAVKP